jgi:RNA polymerase sigma factor (sigma-70 family)
MTPAFALRQRPDAAFETLYRRHVHEVYRYALAMLGDPADAEDVTQTTFLNAYRAFHAGDRPRKPKPWLRAIAHNVCRQRFRQAARRPHELNALDELPAPDVEETDSPSADDIARALRSLPFNQRSALVMRELEGRRQAEIAKELDLSESAVEALLFRARRAMREQLESSLTCGEAARAISRQLDSSLPRAERGALRAHLRECDECAAFARQARAQRGAFKALGAVPLPVALLKWSGGGSAAVESAAVAAGAGAGTVALGIKVAAGIAAALAVAGAGDVAVHALKANDAPPAHRAIAPGHAAGARVSGRVVPLAGTAVLRSQQASAGRAKSPQPTANGGAQQPASHSGQPARHHVAPGRPHVSTGRTSHSGRVRQGHANHARPARPARPAHPTHPVRPVRPAHPPRPAHTPRAGSRNGGFGLGPVKQPKPPTPPKAPTSAP